MEQTKSLYVGFDLGNENSQMSCFHPRTGEIETIGGKTGDNYFFIPTCLAVTEQKKEWLYGQDALLAKDNEEVIFIDNIVARICNNESFAILDITFDAAEILEKFFRKTLVLLQKYYSQDTICKIVVTVEQDNIVLTNAIYQALEKMGILKDRAFVENYTQSYIYYALSQKRELWSQDIALFDYSHRGLVFKKIHMNRKCQPIVVACETTDLSNEFSYEMYNQKQKDELAKQFLEISKSLLYNQDISTLYFVGEGFISDWSDSVLMELCLGKRGFRGPNIYTRGAAYSAKNFDTNEFSKKFLLLSEGVLEHSILLRAYKDGKIREVEIIQAGIPWEEAKGLATVIFDEEDEIQLIIKNALDMTTSERMINLEKMPKRANKMARYQLKFYFESLKTCVISIRDVGFGDFAPSTNRVWEKRLEL